MNNTNVAIEMFYNLFKHKHKWLNNMAIGYYAVRHCSSCGQNQTFMYDFGSGKRTWTDGLLVNLSMVIYVATINEEAFYKARTIVLAQWNTTLPHRRLKFLTDAAELRGKRNLIFFYANWWENEAYHTQELSEFLNRHFSGE